MTGPGPVEPDDLADVAASDTLFDQLGAGRPFVPAQRGDTQPVLTLLADWRTELDERAGTSLSTALPHVPGRSRRWVRAHRRTAAATALVVALAGSTGVAAAASSPSGPLGGLHKLFFGDTPSPPRLDGLAQLAGTMLDAAAADIRAAHAAGTITTAGQAGLAAQLDRVQAVLTRDSQAPQSLYDRLGRLRTTLAAIPVADPAPPAVTDNSGHGGHGADGTDDGSSHTGDGGRGSDGGSQTGDDGGSSDSTGSTDGSTSGGDGSGDNGGDRRSSGDTGSTSGGDDSQSTSGSGDSGTTSGGGDGGADGTSAGDGSGSDGGSTGGDLGGSDNISGSGGSSDLVGSDSTGSSDDGSAGD